MSHHCNIWCIKIVEPSFVPSTSQIPLDSYNRLIPIHWECLKAGTLVTQSDKTSLIARKYTHVYNYIYLLFCVCYSNSVSFIELLRSFCIHGEACAKILCSEKELLNLKDSKLFWQ